MATRGRTISVVACLLCIALTLSLAACADSSAPGPAPLKPKVVPPSIAQAGVLKAGVDLDYPPFGADVSGEPAGIDVEAARALAARLGLRVEIVDVKASQIATALAAGDVDVAFSAPFTSEVLSRATIAGTYLTDGPAVFWTGKPAGSAPVTISPDALPAGKVGVQSASEAYWQVSQRTPQERVAVYPTLRAALQALQNGEVASVAGDALVGAYIARDLSRVTYAGQLAPAHALGVAVSADDSKLSDAVRRQLDAMVADGVLEAIRSAWVGSLPKLVTPSLDASEALVP